MKIIKSKSGLFLVLFTLLSCGVSKKSKENKIAYAKYLASRNIDPIKVNDLDYYDDFFDYKQKQKQKQLLNSSYLKINQVYVYYRNSTSVSFSVFSDDGYEYVSTLDIGGNILDYPENGIVKLKENVILKFFGWFELKKDIIRVSRNYKTPFKEWDEINKGFVNNDTLWFTENYRGKKYGFDKKWLAKTNKLNSKIVYQPSLKARKAKELQFGSDVFVVSGEFFMEAYKNPFE